MGFPGTLDFPEYTLELPRDSLGLPEDTLGSPGRLLGGGRSGIPRSHHSRARASLSQRQGRSVRGSAGGTCINIIDVGD